MLKKPYMQDSEVTSYSFINVAGNMQVIWKITVEEIFIVSWRISTDLIVYISTTDPGSFINNVFEDEKYCTAVFLDESSLKLL